jgi:hypothetical protein
MVRRLIIREKARQSRFVRSRPNEVSLEVRSQYVFSFFLREEKVRFVKA